VGWYEFYFNHKNSWESKLIRISEKRFSNQCDAEEAFCYAEERLTKNRFEKLGGFHNAHNPSALLISSYKNLLTNYYLKQTKHLENARLISLTDLESTEHFDVYAREKTYNPEVVISCREFLLRITNKSLNKENKCQHKKLEFRHKVAWLLFVEEYSMKEASLILNMPYHNINYAKIMFIESCQNSPYFSKD